MTALESRAARNTFRNELAHAKTKRGRLDARAIHAETSDGGAGAMRVYAAIEPEPLWRTLWTRERKALTPKHRAVLDALLVDMRPRVAARIAGIGKDTVYDCFRRIFPQHFAACHRALLLSQ